MPQDTARFGLKNVSIIALLIVLFFNSSYSQQSDSTWLSKVDLRLGLRYSQAMKDTVSRLSAAENPVNVIVRLADPSAPAPEGLAVLSRSGGIAVASLSLDRLAEIASSPSVARIRLPRAYHACDDAGVTSIRAERVQPRLGLTGRGVIIGVLDTGIDWSHPDFIAPDGKSRILYLLDLSDSLSSKQAGDLGQRGPAGGILYTGGMIEQALAGDGNIRERDYIGHGTHVTGVAAASPSTAPGSLVSYGGVAPGADIVFVKITNSPRDSSLSDANIMNGSWFVDSVARALGRPCVINLSLGSDLGAHDGTDELDQFIAALAETGKNRRTVVAAAGNSRVDRIHASGDFSQEADSVVWIEIQVDGGTESNLDALSFQAWLSDGHPGLELQIVTPGGSVSPVYKDGYSLPSGMVEVTPEGSIMVSNAAGGPEPQNGSRLIAVDIIDQGWLDRSAKASPIARGTWKIGLRATKGKFDAYLYGSRWLRVAFRNYYTESGTVGSPAAHPDIIAVGAYVARDDYPALEPPGGSGAALRGAPALGKLAVFSSIGPNRKGLQKPEITAPGQWVVSTLSRAADPVSEKLSIFTSPLAAYPRLLVTPDSVHAVSQGTSFSSPHVAGLCALLFEADPNLDNAAIRNILTETASGDSATGALPNYLFGYGRANAAGAVRRALGISRDTVRVYASVAPRDTLYTDSLFYTACLDLSGSAQALRSFICRVLFPSAVLRPRLRLDSLGRAVEDNRVRFDTSRVVEGVLLVSGTRSSGSAKLDSLFRVMFFPAGPSARDSVELRLEVLSLTGDITQSGMTDGMDVAQAGLLAVGAAEHLLVRGDLDRDGKRTVFDLLALLKVLAGSGKPGSSSDLDGNGKTDVFDLLELLKLLSGGG